jgi:hypothetical protein
MNPWSLAPPVLVAVGNGGNEDVSVVAKRVGLNRREDACAASVNIPGISSAAGALLCAAKSSRSRVSPPASPAVYHLGSLSNIPKDTVDQSDGSEKRGSHVLTRPSSIVDNINKKLSTSTRSICLS